jgi:hypothetical protein
MRCYGADWILLAHGSVQREVLEKTVMNLRVAQKAGRFFFCDLGDYSQKGYSMDLENQVLLQQVIYGPILIV